MKRRDFLKGCGAAAVGVVAAPTVVKAAKPDSPSVPAIRQPKGVTTDVQRLITALLGRLYYTVDRNVRIYVSPNGFSLLKNEIQKHSVHVHRDKEWRLWFFRGVLLVPFDKLKGIEFLIMEPIQFDLMCSGQWWNEDARRYTEREGRMICRIADIKPAGEYPVAEVVSMDGKKRVYCWSDVGAALDDCEREHRADCRRYALMQSNHYTKLR